MRVLLINVVCGVGSTGRICTELAREFERQGHEVKVAYGRGDIPKEYEKYAVKIGGKRDVYLHALKARVFDDAGFGSKGATRKFLKWLDEYSPDIIWLHNLHGYYINIELLFQWIKAHPEKEIKWTLHDCWAFTGHCVYFTMAKCDKWKEGCRRCPQKKEYPSSIWVDRSQKNYLKKKKLFCGIKNMRIITPSQWLADLVRQSFLHEYPVEVRHNRIDTTVFRPTENDVRAKYGLEEKQIILGVANIWDKRKGLEDFLELSSLLEDKYHIILVGLSQKQIELLPSHIIGIKKTESTKALAELYSAADFFINLTYEDNYPTVNLEAESCGTRVLTYDTGGSRETIKRSDSRIVPTGDLGQIARIIVGVNDL